MDLKLSGKKAVISGGSRGIGLAVCKRLSTEGASVAFCARMLAEAGIAASAGVDFDRTRGHRTLRFSYCGPEADMRAAAKRLTSWR